MYKRQDDKEQRNTLIYAWWGKGATLKTLGEFKKAIEAYNEAIKLVKNFTYLNETMDIYYEKAELLNNIGMYDEAIETIKEALKLKLKDNKKKIFQGILSLLKIKNAFVKGKLEEAFREIEKGRKIKVYSVILDLWEVYSKYFKLKIEDKPDWQRELTLLIGKLEQIKDTFERQKSDEKRIILELVYYWLGVFYYKLGDIVSSHQNLEKVLKIDRLHRRAKELLGYIWNSLMRPSWWRWWFFAPKPLNGVLKFIVGTIITLLIIFMSLLPLLQTISTEFSFITVSIEDRILIIVLAILALFSPSLTRFKISEFEVEISLPMDIEPTLSLPAMERPLKEISPFSKPLR